MIAALVDAAECPCPWTHGAACGEFLEGFTAFGFQTRVVRSLAECVGCDILLLSNHRIDWVFLDALAAACPNTLFILWAYHPHVARIPFKHWILTGEHYWRPPTLQTHLPSHRIAESLPNFVPLRLRVNEAPERVGTWARPAEPRHLACFMGTPYKCGWAESVRDLGAVFYHSIYNGFLTNEQRRDVHLNSVFGLGFHSDENVANNHVTQRVFEAMAYGCVVLTDNPAAEEMTGGIAVLVRSPAELKERMEWFLARPDELAAKREAGYVWIRAFGTNRYAAGEFMRRAEELWGWVGGSLGPCRSRRPL